MNLYSKIWKNLYRYKWMLCLLFGITIARLHLMYLLPDSIRNFFDSIASGKSVYLHSAFMVAAIMLGSILLNFIGNVWLQRIGFQVLRDVRSKFVKKALKLPYSKLLDYKTGDLISRIIGDAQAFQEFAVNIAIGPIISFATIVIYIVVLFRINVFLSSLVIATFPALSILAGKFHRKLMDVATVYRSMYGVLYNKLVELFKAVKLIKSMKFEDKHHAIMEEEFSKISKQGTRVEVLSKIYDTSIQLTTTAGELIVLILGGLLVLQQKMSIASFITYYMFLGMVYSSLQSVTISLASYQKGKGMIQRVLEIVEQPEDDKKGGRKIKIERGDVKVEKVTFYQGERAILKNFSCEFFPNSINVIFGPSGAGKTTLLDLLLKLYEPDKGRILIDGYDLSDISDECYSRYIGVFTQDPIIFDTTIEENIKYFKPEATREEVEEAIKRAGLQEFVKKLPDGLNSQVGEMGNKISGGEKARIALARIFLRKPKIVFLDEPTANVDPETEELIFKSLSDMKKDSTIIMITHNEKAKELADNLVEIA